MDGSDLVRADDAERQDFDPTTVMDAAEEGFGGSR